MILGGAAVHRCGECMLLQKLFHGMLRYTMLDEGIRGGGPK